MLIPVRIFLRLIAAQAAPGSADSAWLELIKIAVGALGPIVAALIAGLAAAIITQRYTTQREAAERAAVDLRHEKDIEGLNRRHELDKESEWRSHAVELTKLEIQRKLELWKGSTADKRTRLRPAILDFLANYRDLIELDKTSPRELYLKILADRISHLTEEEKAALSPEELKEAREVQEKTTALNAATPPASQSEPQAGGPDAGSSAPANAGPTADAGKDEEPYDQG